MGKSSKFKKLSIFSRLNFLLLILFLILVSLIGYKILILDAPPKVETEQTEVKKLPKNIAKNLKKDLPKTKTYKIPILLYHYVEYVKDPKDTIRISLNILPITFDDEVKTLKEAGYTFLTAKDVANIIDGKTSLPKKPIVLTFDDGYRDFYTDVFPILKKYQIKAVAYVVPGFLDKPNNLTHNQLKEIAHSNLVEIGAHTVFHTYLKGLNEKRLKFEVTQSKQMLEQELQIKVVSFAYPYGAFDDKAVEVVKDAGFKTAVSTVPGIDASLENRFFLFRLRPSGRTGEALIKFLEQSKFPEY